VNGHISLSKRREDLVDSVVADVHQHVCIGGEHDSIDPLIPGLVRDMHVDRFTAIVVFEGSLVRHRCNTIIMKLEPSSLSIGLDNSKVISIVQITRMDQDSV
jgi:hypothetical protein